MKIRKKKADLALTLQAIVAALEKHIPKKSITLNAVTLPVDVLVSKLNVHLALMRNTAAAHTHWIEAVTVERTSYADIARLLLALEAFVRATFGESSATYAEFGYTPRKAPKRSAASKARAMDKRRATLKQRNAVGVSSRVTANGSSTSLPSS